jgi:hypothetical protein
MDRRLELEGAVVAVTGMEVKLRVHNWMIEHTREVRLSSCIIAILLLIIYNIYFDTTPPLISIIFVVCAEGILLYEALKPENKLREMLLKISPGWISLLGIITLFSTIYLNKDIVAMNRPIIGYVTYIMLLIYGMVRIQKEFDKKIRDPKVKDYKRYVILFANIFIMAIFIFISQFVGIWVYNILQTP